MNLSQLISLLNEDLAREYMHWHFYMNAAIRVQTLHRAEIQELMLEEAAGEMKHVEAFGKLIVGLGGTPTVKVASFESDITDPKIILEEALKMEEEVVTNYVQRMDDAEKLESLGGVDKVHGRYVHIFLEDQILDSRQAVDHYRELIAGLKSF
jgi:bacterioferritin (cytochrome b1)